MSPILLVVEGCVHTPCQAGSWNIIMSTYPAYLSSMVETVSHLFRALKERIEIDLNFFFFFFFFLNQWHLKVDLYSNLYTTSK
jgi:hypothetical protein